MSAPDDCSRLIVIKLGGSLLSLPDLSARLSEVLARFEGCRRLVVVGGGTAADVVREWDRLHGLGEEAAHWLGVQAMSLNVELVRRLLPGSTLIASRAGLESAASAGCVALLDAYHCLRDLEAAGRPTVPHVWEATSDSIAAWLAGEWDADELVLLKSVDRPAGDWDRLAAAGVVDRLFPGYAAHAKKVRWINLRGMASPVLESGTPCFRRGC